MICLPFVQYHELSLWHLLQWFPLFWKRFLYEMQILAYLISVYFFMDSTPDSNFFFPPPNCVLRHTRRSISSRKFSHQLLQRTTKFWASFDVSPYFIFLVDTSTNSFDYSGQWLLVFKWQILCLTLSLTCTFIHRWIGIEYLYTGMYWVLSCPT